VAQPRYEESGTSMGNALRSILIRLVAYVAVAIAAGLLLLAGATVYALMWPRCQFRTHAPHQSSR
jgi:hypothetical protein